jgi:uncharacterized protein YdcH (DUF465 family)
MDSDMKKTLTPQERDAFAIAVSDVEGLTRTSELSALIGRFKREKTCLKDQIAEVLERYSLAK